MINKKIQINKTKIIFFIILVIHILLKVLNIFLKKTIVIQKLDWHHFMEKKLHNLKLLIMIINKVTELLGRHKTLPIPSMVKITNLENGLSINIKIIDRHNDNQQLIQVSRKVGQLLGFYKDKIATVKVDIISDASKQWKNVIVLNEENFNDTISSAPTSIVSI